MPTKARLTKPIPLLRVTVELCTELRSERVMNPCGAPPEAGVTVIVACVGFLVVGLTESEVVVAAGPPPPLLLLLHPSVKLSTQIRPRPSAVRYRFRPGRNSRNIAARPVPALSIHQLLFPPDGIKPAA